MRMRRMMMRTTKPAMTTMMRRVRKRMWRRTMTRRKMMMRTKMRRRSYPMRFRKERAGSEEKVLELRKKNQINKGEKKLFCLFNY